MVLLLAFLGHETDIGKCYKGEIEPRAKCDPSRRPSGFDITQGMIRLRTAALTSITLFPVLLSAFR